MANRNRNAGRAGTPSIPACVVYCRVSSDRQAAADKTSLDDQERRGRATAARLGLPIVYVARHAESAWVLDKRSLFQAVLDDARAGRFSVLIVDRMNRFSRSEDLSDPLLVLRELRDLGIRVEFSDRQYADGLLGQAMQLLDLFGSAKEQEARRKASYAGKVGRVTKHGYPLPSRRPPYGYVWAPTPDGAPKKTTLLKDPGAAQAVVERIWQHFLAYTPTVDRPRPTVRGLVTQLNREQVPPPTVYHAVPDKTGRRRGIWTLATVQRLLHNGVYWGEPRAALSASKFRDQQPPVPIPAYAPPYVTPEEAARVHALVQQNAAHCGRPRTRDYGTLLHAGLVYCGYCGKRMDPVGLGRRLPDGTRPIRYRCSEQASYGKVACAGTNIHAGLLDWAVIVTLDAHLRHGRFLDQLFAAWDADETAAQGQVRTAQAALDDAQQQLANLVQHAARVPADSPAGAALQLQLEQVSALIPRFEARVAAAQAAVNEVRGNAALRDDLQAWFAAWLDGFQELPRARQREFLFAVQARVTVWREADRQPRAELVIGLPADALSLPPAPDVVVTAKGWQVPLDLDQGAVLAAADRTPLILPPDTPEQIALRQAWAAASPADVVAATREALADQRFILPKGSTTSSRRKPSIRAR